MTALRQSLARGAGFLLAGQDPDGGWRDFDLRPGVSTAWTTAYVAARLAGLVEPPAGAAASLEAAAGFLRRHREPGGGWAYNRRCPADADSTALALLFLADREPPPNLKDVAVLAAFQGPDGGFATYRPWREGLAWAGPHPEVTATALRALSRFLPPDHIILRRGFGWLERQASRPDRPSYWWVTPAYLALEQTRLGRPAAAQLPVPGSGKGAFAVALELELAILSGAPSTATEPAVRDLIARQEPQGEWSSEPILRLPDPSGAPSASLHADQNRLFTTATVLSALDAALRRADRRSAELPPSV